MLLDINDARLTKHERETLRTIALRIEGGHKPERVADKWRAAAEKLEAGRAMQISTAFDALTAR